MPHELELKFQVPRTDLLALEKSAWLRRLSREAPENRKLVSVYYDTKDRALRDREISFRVRRIGNQYLQTVKARASEALDRCEWENPISSGKPDRVCARHTALKPFTDKKRWRELRPLFETNIRRTTIDASVGDSRIELALDHGTISAERRRMAVNEIELELKEGSSADLIALARKLQIRMPLALETNSKAARGYALYDQALADHRKASSIPLNDDLSTEAGFRAIAMACLAQIIANKNAVLRKDPEGIHQMRVGLRRLRTALSLFKSMIDGPETKAIKDDLKWLSEQLGPARDFDVLQGHSIKPMEVRRPDDPGLKALEEDVAARRATGFEQALRMVQGDRYRDIILKTGLWALGGKWTWSKDDLRTAQRKRPLPDSARDILKARTAKVIKKLKKFDRMDDLNRHKLRIAVKKLRYAIGFFDALFLDHNKRRKDFAAALKQLQSALGRLNDIRVHGGFANDVIRRSKRSPKSKARVVVRAYGLGQLTGRERLDRKACLKEAGKAGKRFSTLKPYWGP
ncbi:MAG TPA: CHAD domain-containing protein [Rhizomicrobium sp.]